MRYTDKEGNTLEPNEYMTADSFLMETDIYVCEPLEMHFNSAISKQERDRRNQ